MLETGIIHCLEVREGDADSLKSTNCESLITRRHGRCCTARMHVVSQDGLQIDSERRGSFEPLDG